MHTALYSAADLQEAVRASARARRIGLRMTQQDLASRSGVPIATLKRFEQRGEASLSTVMAIAEALDALEGFRGLFPAIEAKTLEDLDRQASLPKRVRRPRADV